MNNIIAMAMNQISDIKFAVACRKAGVMPSVSVFNYPNERDYFEIAKDLKYYHDEIGDTDLLFSLYAVDLKDKSLLKILLAMDVTAIEVILPWTDYDLKDMRKTFVQVRRLGFKLYLRQRGYKVGRFNGALVKHVDGVILKGDKGAGAKSPQDLDEMYDLVRADCPTLKIIVAGGISTKEQIQHYLDKGANGIGIGTLFAASQESKMSTAAKQLLIDKDFSDVTASEYKDKNDLVIKPVYTKDPNLTLSLKLGLNRPDLGGHIYAGEGINNIKAIRPLKDIVADLI